MCHEALSQPQAAMARYQRALTFFPDHSFLVYLSLGLLERHPDLDFDRRILLQSLRRIQRQRHNYVRITFILYHELLLRLFPELSGRDQALPPPPQPRFSEYSETALPSAPPPAGTGSSHYFLRLIENPDEPIPSGLLVVEGESVCVVRLPAMLFQLIRCLAAAMRQERHLPHAPEAQGWVSILELTENLPGLDAEADGEAAISRLAAKLREQLKEAGVRQELLEQNSAGSFRLAAAPSQIVLEPNSSAKI